MTPSFFAFAWVLPATAAAAATAAATTTSIATTAAATATAAAETASAAAAFTRNHRPGFVHSQRSSFVVLTVELLDGLSALLVRRHFDKAESFATAGIAIRNHLRGIDLADLFENRSEAVISGGKRKVSNVQFLTHILLSLVPIRTRTRPQKRT